MEGSGRAIKWAAIQGWSAKVIAFVVFALVANRLSPSELGVVAASLIVIRYGTVIVESGLGQAIVQAKEVTKELLDTTFIINAMLGMIASIIVLLSSGIFAELFSMPALAEPLAWLSLCMLFSGLSAVHQAVLQRAMNFKSLAARDFVSNLFSGVIGVYLAINGFGLWALVAQNLVSSFSKMVVLFIASGWRPGLAFTSSSLREVYSYGLNVLGLGLLNETTKKSDDILIGLYLGSASLGIYSLAYRLYDTLSQTSFLAVGNAFFSIFSKARKDVKLLGKLYMKYVSVSVAIFVPIFLCVIAVSGEAISIAFGEKWIVAVPIFDVLMVASVVRIVNFVSIKVLLSNGLAGYVFKLNLCVTIVTVILFMLVVDFGLLAVAVVLASRVALLVLPFALYRTLKILNIRFYDFIKAIIVPIIWSFMIFGVVAFIEYFGAFSDSSLFFALFVKVLIYAVYPIGLYVFDRSLFFDVVDVFKSLRRGK